MMFGRVITSGIVVIRPVASPVMERVDDGSSGRFEPTTGERCRAEQPVTEEADAHHGDDDDAPRFHRDAAEGTVEARRLIRLVVDGSDQHEHPDQSDADASTELADPTERSRRLGSLRRHAAEVQFVADVVTKPDPSPLIVEARRIGCATMPGAGMFDAQAQLLVDRMLTMEAV